jgi:hypothetical protein
LFLFVFEVFSSLIKKACEEGYLQGIKLSQQGPMLSHLFFADDSLFFLKATPENCTQIMKIIDVYCTASGQLVNSAKSSICYTPNMDIVAVNNLCAILGVPATINPGRNLGLPTIWGRSKKASLCFVKARLSDKIQNWKLCTLSMAGRETFIKSVAQVVPTFPMHCFKFPLTLCKELDAMMANFWWG